MPAISDGDVRIHYVLSGREDGDVLVMSNSLGSSLRMWDKVLTRLESRYRILRYDTRGHGASTVAPEAYTLDQLGQDVLNLLDAIGAESVSFCGLSLGGMTGMWLGLRAPHRLNHLILANTAARIGTSEMWDERIDLVRQSGIETLAVATLSRWFTPPYRESHPDEMDQIQHMIASTTPEGYCACCAVLRETDLRARISSIAVPTLIIAGTHDPATPPSDGRSVAAAIPGAKYTELDASHLSAWERADDFADAVQQFLGQGVRRN